MYNMLYVKSNYSLLSSLLTIDDIIDYNIKNNRTNAVICDDNMYGTMEFIKKCHLKKIKPVVGLGVSFDNYKILLYIKNYHGYLNLIKICTRVNDNSITLDDIIKYKDNLFILVPFDSLNFYLEYKDKFTDIYLGFSNKKEESEALVITKDIVYLKPCLYKRKEDSDYLKYLYLIRDGKTLNDNISYDTLNKADKRNPTVVSSIINKMVAVGDINHARKICLGLLKNNPGSEILEIISSWDISIPDVLKLLKSQASGNLIASQVNVPLLKAIANMELHEGLLKEAQEHYEKAFELNQSPDICLKLASIMSSQRYYDKATMYYEKALKLGAQEVPSLEHKAS